MLQRPPPISPWHGIAQLTRRLLRLTPRCLPPPPLPLSVPPRLPYYDPAKVVFLVWCFHPSSQGCALVYRWVIRPLFLPREDAIDRSIARLSASLAQASTEVKQLLLKKVAKRIAGTEDTPRKEAHQHRA